MYSQMSQNGPILMLCSRCTGEMAFENPDLCNQRSAAAAGIADGFSNFSKFGPTLILYSECTGELAFENPYQRSVAAPGIADGFSNF